MKKVLISMLLVVLTLCLFIGCDGDSVETLFKEKIEPTPEPPTPEPPTPEPPTPEPPTPTTKTISVEKYGYEEFTFEILTSSTTWEEVKGSLTGNWELSDNDTGRLVLTNTSTPTDTYYVTQTLGEEFLKSSDTIGDTTIIYMVNPDDYTMKKGTEWFTTLVGTSGITKDKITEIHFVKNDTTGIDLTKDGTGKVKGYVVEDEGNYKIYIVGDYIFGNEDCENMFKNFKNLTTLDLSNFDTSKVENMSTMFGSCSKLTSLNLSNFDTSKVENMSTMFGSCSSLTSINFGNFDTSKVTDMYGMFYSCSGLTSIDLSSFNTSNVSSMKQMFNGCTSLTYLNLSSFKTLSVTDMETMFKNCSNLEELDLSSFVISGTPTSTNMFNNCGKTGTTIKINPTYESFFEGLLSSWTYDSINTYTKN